MKDALEKVTEFHGLIGACVGESPRLLSAKAEEVAPIAGELRSLARRCCENEKPTDELRQRLSMALEELAEWVEAHAADNLVAAADAWGDRLYVLLGDAVAAGLPGDAIFQEVHRSNLTKAQRRAGANGKAVKDDLFIPPCLAPLLGLAADTNVSPEK